MSDTTAVPTIDDVIRASEAAQDAAEPEPEAPETPEPEAPADAEEAPEEDEDKPLTRAEAKALREENARRRIENRDLNDAFGQWDPETRAQFVGMIASVGKDDPMAVARHLETILDRIYDEHGAPADGADPEPSAPAAPAADDEKPLTRAEVKALLEQERAAEAKAKADAEMSAQQEQAIESVYAEAEKLGYKRESPEFLTLMARAATLKSIEAAHAEQEALKKAIADEAVAAYKKKINEKHGDLPDPSPQGTGAVTPTKPSTDPKDTQRRAREFLDAAFSTT